MNSLTEADDDRVQAALDELEQMENQKPAVAST